MTFQASLRELPIRVPITDGESLPSWIEAVAARYKMTVRELLPALALPAPRKAYGLVLGTSSRALRSLERQAELAPGRLNDAVLDRYSALGLAVASSQVSTGERLRNWARGSGSGFCPSCLVENGGRWLLSWQLYWTFACIRHNVLMASRCAVCGRPPRNGENRLDHLIDSRNCCHYRLEARLGRKPGPGLPRCGASLTEQPVQELGSGHPLIVCQKWIDDVLAMPADTPVAGLQVPPKAALSALAILMRSIAITEGSLVAQRVSHLGMDPAAVNSLARIQPTGSAARAYSTLSTSPALFGTVAALAVDILASPCLRDAADAMTWIVSTTNRRTSSRGTPSPRLLATGETGSPVLDAIVLRQRAVSLRPADRLAFRTENAVPRRPPTSANATRTGEWPFIPDRLISVPARLVPQVAWRAVASTLVPAGLQDTGTPAAILSMCVVHSGIYADWSHIAAWLMLPPGFGRTASFILRKLERSGRLEGTLTAVDALVEVLTSHPPPIDYARRRWLFRDLELVRPARLRRACHAAGLVLSERRLRYATMLLWENLTGGDVRFADGRLAPQNPDDRADYASFRNNYEGALSEYLQTEGERLLLRHRIDEPVTWQPELKAPSGEAWLSPPPNPIRLLPGWEHQRQRGTLRRGALDHTPRVANSRLRLPAGHPRANAEEPVQSGDLARTPWFLIDLANWPFSGQIGESLAK